MDHASGVEAARHDQGEARQSGAIERRLRRLHTVLSLSCMPWPTVRPPYEDFPKLASPGWRWSG